MLSAMVPSNVSLRLNVDSASDPISGSLIHPDGRRQMFSGWIELTAALEEVRHPERSEVVAHSHTDPGGCSPSQDPTTQDSTSSDRRTSPGSRSEDPPSR